jgi:hypothetical protein
MGSTSADCLPTREPVHHHPSRAQPAPGGGARPAHKLPSEAQVPVGAVKQEQGEEAAQLVAEEEEQRDQDREQQQQQQQQQQEEGAADPEQQQQQKPVGARRREQREPAAASAPPPRALRSCGARPPMAPPPLQDVQQPQDSGGGGPQLRSARSVALQELQQQGGRRTPPPTRSSSQQQQQQQHSGGGADAAAGASPRAGGRPTSATSAGDEQQQQQQQPARPGRSRPARHTGPLYASEIVGRRCAILRCSRGSRASWWEKAKVVEWDGARQQHKLLYITDGRSEEWLSLGDVKFKWEGLAAPGAAPNPTHRPEMEREAALGRRLRLYWPAMQKWYIGQVKEYDAKTDKHVIWYRDGDAQTLCLRHEPVVWIDAGEMSGGNSSVTPSPAGAAPGAAAGEVEDADAEEAVKEEEEEEEDEDEDDKQQRAADKQRRPRPSSGTTAAAAAAVAAASDSDCKADEAALILVRAFPRTPARLLGKHGRSSADGACRGPFKRARGSRSRPRAGHAQPALSSAAGGGAAAAARALAPVVDHPSKPSLVGCRVSVYWRMDRCFFRVGGGDSSSACVGNGLQTVQQFWQPCHQLDAQQPLTLELRTPPPPPTGQAHQLHARQREVHDQVRRRPDGAAAHRARARPVARAARRDGRLHTGASLGDGGPVRPERRAGAGATAGDAGVTQPAGAGGAGGDGRVAGAGVVWRGRQLERGRGELHWSADA